MAQLFLKFFPITQQKVPFINTSEATKRLSRVTEQRMANVQMSQTVEVLLAYQPQFTQTTTTITRRHI